MQFLGIAVNYAAVHKDWHNMHLSPPTAYLFVPNISAIPTHWQALEQGRHIDMWLMWVYQAFGMRIFLGTIAVLLAMLAISLWLIRVMWASTTHRGKDRGQAPPLSSWI